MRPDPVIDQIRAARHRISEQCGHDAKRLLAYYLKRQQGLVTRLVVTQEAAVRDDKA